MTAVLAGLLFGLVGSGHCAAMCGPLVALTVPREGDDPNGRRAAMGVALYHGGRMSTYLVLGALAGLIGSSIARAGLGRVVAVVAGVALVTQALIGARIVPHRMVRRGPAQAITRALARAGAWMRAHDVAGPLAFGALNGLLPCGLLYAALVAAAGLADLRESLAFIAAFAVGTAPALVLLAVASRTLANHMPLRIRRVAPVALAVVGVLLIARGIQEPHAGHTSHAAPAASPSSVHHAH